MFKDLYRDSEYNLPYIEEDSIILIGNNNSYDVVLTKGSKFICYENNNLVERNIDYFWNKYNVDVLRIRYDIKSLDKDAHEEVYNKYNILQKMIQK